LLFLSLNVFYFRSSSDGTANFIARMLPTLKLPVYNNAKVRQNYRPVRKWIDRGNTFTVLVWFSVVVNLSAIRLTVESQ